MVTVVDVTEIRVHAVRCDGVTHAHACFLPSLLSFVGVHRKRGDGSPLARPFISCAVSAYLATKQPLFLPARRYASAGTSYGPVSVCLSQVGVLLKWLDGSSWFLAWRLLSTSSTLCFKEIQVCTKIRALPFGTFFVNSGLRKFRHGL